MVVDTNGKGVEGAEVRLPERTRIIALGYSGAISSAKSDALGNYSLTGLPLDASVELIPRFDANQDGLDNDHRFFIKASQPFAAGGTFLLSSPSFCNPLRTALRPS